MLLLFIFVILFDSLLGHLIASLDFVLQIIVVAHELAVFRIVNAFSRMESQRQHFERILTNNFIVLSHINEDSLLIRQLLVVLHPVVKFERQNNLIRFILLKLLRAVHWGRNGVSRHANWVVLAW